LYQTNRPTKWRAATQHNIMYNNNNNNNSVFEKTPTLINTVTKVALSLQLSYSADYTVNYLNTVVATTAIFKKMHCLHVLNSLKYM